uniref:Polygalacturonase n=1 Tax=Cajanus cajan TaxID=3821 RepID=A0A151S847_CAJCA|nr:putative polygalacturonase [Cajanus cajan]
MEISYLNALRFGLKRIFFGGFFIRGHAYTMDAISFAIHFCNVQIQNITSRAPAESPYTSGIVPVKAFNRSFNYNQGKYSLLLFDSSQYVCIENSNISTGHDAIVLKSGWDQYGISYGKPTSSVHISNVYLQSSSGAGLALGSEMSGGIHDIFAEKLHILNSPIGIELKTTRGRGGYMKGILISDAELENICLGISMTGFSGFHPDDEYNTSAFPVVGSITFKNVIGANIGVAGNFSGFVESPFSTICLSNATFFVSSEASPSWFCSNVVGFSEEVFPEPCTDLQSSDSKFSFSCFSSLYPQLSNVSAFLDHHPQEL